VIEVSDKIKLGSVLADINLNPSRLRGTRFSQESTLWSRWRPNKLTIRVVTSAGTFVSGSYMIGWSATQETVHAGLEAIRRVATFVPNQQAQVAQNVSITIPCTGPSAPAQRWLFVDPHQVDESSHGALFLVCAAPLANLKGSISLSLHLDWEVQFSNPDIETDVVKRAVYARDGWSPYHVTSDGDWKSGKYYGLKATAGGDMVPFDYSTPGEVYELDASAKMAMRVNDKILAEVGFGVVIHDSPYPYHSFTVFPRGDSGRNWAEKYAASPDDNYLYNYVEAGLPITPTNPAWYPRSVTKSVLLSNRGRMELLAGGEAHSGGC
jgi:hypothetical protein